MDQLNYKPRTSDHRRKMWIGAISFLCVLIFGILFTATVGIAANKAIIKGKVFDAETKKPLKSATVVVSSLRVGAITDEKGEFSFDAPAGEYFVEAKFIGFETVSNKIETRDGKTTLVNFELSVNPIKANEMVVIGITGEVDRGKLGNTITSINGNEIQKVVSASAIDALSGRVAGMEVMRNSGTPGAGTYITIRGRKTINGSSEPLYVIDGIIMDNSSLYDASGTVQYSNRATDINPEDIESMEVLKGASAAALYGSRAANGVVLISTKHGKLSSYDKPASIAYTGSFQIDQKTDHVPLQTIYGQKPKSNTTYNFTVDTTQATTMLTKSVKLDPSTPTYVQDDVPFRTGYSSEHSVEVSGGVPQFDYLLSLTDLKQEGYVIGSDYNRTSVRANVGTSILPEMSLQNNFNYVSINNNLPQDGSNVSGIMLGALRTPPDFNNNVITNANGTQHKFAAYDNPLWTQLNNKFNSKIDRILESANLKWHPLTWASLDMRYGLDWYQYKNIQRLAVGSGASPDAQGLIDKSNILNKQQNFDITATFKQKFFEDILDMNLVVGSQTVWFDNNSSDVNSNHTLPFFDQIGAGPSISGSSYEYHSKTVGIFAQLSTSLWNRITTTLGLRRDGSSVFGQSQQFYYFPKAGLSYILSDESFMKDMKEIISYARLRSSWGEAGSPSVPGIYSTNFLFGTSGFFDPWDRATTVNRNGFTGIRQGGGASGEYIVAGAENIRPELSIEREVGIDLGFLKDRIGLEATFYHTDIFDMVLSVPVPSSTGYDKQLRNAAQMYNEGFEVALKATPWMSDEVKWATQVNWSRNYNLVTKLDISLNPTGNEYQDLTGAFTGLYNVAMVGRPLGTYFGYGWLRDENGKLLYSGDKIRANADGSYERAPNGGVYRDNGTHIKADDVSYVLEDDWGSTMSSKTYFRSPLLHAPIQDAQQKVLGNSNPAYRLSWKNDITIFKDITIGFLFDGAFDFQVWNGTKGALNRFGTDEQTLDRDEPWFNFDGQPVTTTGGKQVSRLVYYSIYSNQFNGVIEPFIEDGSFIKLRELSVEYRWHGLDEWKISTMTFRFSARNLWKWTRYTGFDPEVNTFSNAEGRGMDYFTLPQVTSYRFGLTINY
ncbi:MAG: SusC/RagA family TonB-linked outer membrane protein [Candidatus Kapabacteria bacterium]|nr:SusC/RagA family TonB-linked outer membrane protein [Candidatus Kapabacteria bacterium]